MELHKCLECNKWEDCPTYPWCQHPYTYFCEECLTEMVKGADNIGAMLEGMRDPSN